MTNFNIGNRIRELRIKKGLSQEQLALESDITPAYMGLLERNQKSPTIRVLERICKNLDVSLADFFSDIEMEPFEEESFFMQNFKLLTRGKNIQELTELLIIIREILRFRDLDR